MVPQSGFIYNETVLRNIDPEGKFEFKKIKSVVDSFYKLNTTDKN